MPISYRAAQTLIKRGDEAALRTALDNGLDPNLTNENGWSLLMLAAVEGAEPCGRLLAERGADVHQTNRHGETALSLAAQKGHLPFLQLLLAHGAKTDGRPHGLTLSDWINAAAGLTRAQRTEVLQVLGV